MPGVASAIAATVVSAIGAKGIAATIITAVIRTVVGIGVSVLSQLLFGQKPEENDRGITTSQTTTGDTTPQKFPVGLTALEGHLMAPTYTRHGKKNKIATYILAVSNLPVKGLTGRVIIDGQYADILNEAPAGPGVNSSADRLDGFRNSSNKDFAWIVFYDGTQTAADSFLVQEYGSHPERPWTTDHIAEGTAYAILEFKQDAKYFNSLPAVRFEIEGISLYDPRKDTTVGGSGAHRWNDSSTYEFTQNPQVINYNVLRGITLPSGDVYGGGVPAEDLPLDNWFAAMNECDVSIGGRTQFQAGIEIDTNEMEPLEVIREMNKASFAQMSTLGGVFRVRVGAPAASVMDLSDADFVINEGSNRHQFPGLKNTNNAISATYVSPPDVWEQRTADPIRNAAWETEDGGRRQWVNVNFRAVSDNSQVQQLMQAMINDDRRFVSHKMTLPPSFARLELLDTVAFTSSKFGYTDKVFEVIGIEHDPTTIQQTVDVREREATDNDWTSGDDLPVPLARNGYVFPDPLDFDTFGVTPFTLQDASFNDRRPAIRISWTFLADDADEAPEDQLVEWQLRHITTGDIIDQGVTLASKLEVKIGSGIIAGEAYEGRGRTLASPFEGPWTSWLTATAPGVLIDTVDVEDEAVTAYTDAFGSGTVSDSASGFPVVNFEVQTLSISLDANASVDIIAAFEAEILGADATHPWVFLQGNVLIDDGVSSTSLLSPSISRNEGDDTTISYHILRNHVVPRSGIWTFDVRVSAQVFVPTNPGVNYGDVTLNVSERFLQVRWTKK